MSPEDLKATNLILDVAVVDSDGLFDDDESTTSVFRSGRVLAGGAFGAYGMRQSSQPLEDGDEQTILWTPHRAPSIDPRDEQETANFRPARGRRFGDWLEATEAVQPIGTRPDQEIWRWVAAALIAAVLVLAGISAILLPTAL